MPKLVYPPSEHFAPASEQIGAAVSKRPALAALVASVTAVRFADSPLLGTIANSSSPQEEEAQKPATYGHALALLRKEQQEEQKNKKTVERFAMQSAARALLGPEARVWHCLRSPSWNSDGVDCFHIPAVRGARLGGLQTCGSVWGCPVCAAKITERRRVELRRAVDAWLAEGGSVALLTYTRPHRAEDELRGLVDGVFAARSRMMSGRAYHEKKKACGLAGSVRCLEVTHGVNGWHPHPHELAFFHAGADVAGFCDWLGERWGRSVAAVGAGLVNEHGFKWSVAGHEITDYIAKFGHEPTAPVWDCAAEITKHPAKLGRVSGRSPMQLLADFTRTGDCEAGDLYRAYAVAMKGRRQLEWSRWDTGERTDKGRAKTISFLTHILPEVEEVSDLTLAECAEERGVLMARLSLSQWRLILADDVRAGLLNVLRTGDADALAVFLAPYAQPDGAGRVTVNDRLRLADPFADERDVLKPVGLYADPLTSDADALEHWPGLTSAAAAKYRRIHADDLEAGGVGLSFFTERAAERAAAAAALLSSPALLPAKDLPAPALGPGLFDEVEKPGGSAVLGSGVPGFSGGTTEKQDTGPKGGEKHGKRQGKASGSVGSSAGGVHAGRTGRR